MTLSIRLFGELDVALDGQRIAPPSGRTCELLAWLAVNPGPHARPRVAACFWPAVPDPAARASLRSAVWSLRAALGPVGERHLIADRGNVGLRADDGLRTDLDEFHRLAGQGRAAEALRLCAGELLQPFDQDWAVEARAEHTMLLSAVLAQLTEQAGAAGDLPTAVAAARRQVALLPHDEAAARTLITLLAETGDVTAALEVHARLRRTLLDDLGAGVSAATAGLVRRLRLRHDGAAERPRMIGRGAELATLTRAWRAAAAGQGSVVLLTGDGGMGKTRLVQELSAAVAGEGARTLAGYAGGPGGGAPFALWSGTLDGITPDPVGADPRVGPGAERIRQLEHATRLLQRAAREGPLLLVLEDVHRADPSSLELLAYAGRRLGGRLPVLLVATRRRRPARPEADAAMAALRACGGLDCEIELTALSDLTIRRIAQTHGTVTGEQLDRITELAGGSPLLAVETARIAALDGADLSAGLRGAVRAAAERLTPPARRFTAYAAAAGRALLPGEVSALPLPAPTRAATEALGSGLLQSGAHGIGFRHALLRKAFYDDLPAPERAELHADLAALLRANPAGRSGRARNAAELGRQLRLAGLDGAAGEQFAEAAAAARAVCALPEAAEFLREALELDPDSAALLLELAEVEAWRGRLPSSDEAFARALERIGPADAEPLVRAWLRRGHWLRGGVCHPRESRRSYLSALDLLDRSPGDRLPARAEALAGLAWAEAVAGDPAEAEHFLREVAAITGQQAPDDLLAHDIGSTRGHALIRAGRLTESYGPLVAAGAAAGRAGRPELAYSCLINASAAAACAGEWERALDFADRCLALVVPNGLLRAAVCTHCARAAVLRRLGRSTEAAAAADAAGALAARTGLPDLAALVHHERGLLALATGDPATAAAELERALAPGGPVGRPRTRMLLAEALARAGRPDEAERQLRQAVLEPVSAGDFPDALVGTMARVQGLVAAARDDRALAARRFAEASAVWSRRRGGPDGEGLMRALIDLGRPAISSLVEPDRELAAVEADLAALSAAAAHRSDGQEV